MVVVKFEDMTNNLLSILITWPCHGSVNSQDNFAITGDWPETATTFIKKQAGKEVVVAVTVGASADINPIYGADKNFIKIETVGSNAETETWKTLAKTTTYPLKSLQASYTTMTFPGKKAGSGYFPLTPYESGPDVEIRLTTLKIGNMVLSGVSGELLTEIGMEVKKRSPYSVTLIVTHCNGSSGYICRDKSFPEGGYEVTITTLLPGAEKSLTQK